MSTCSLFKRELRNLLKRTSFVSVNSKCLAKAVQSENSLVFSCTTSIKNVNFSFTLYNYISYSKKVYKKILILNGQLVWHLYSIVVKSEHFVRSL